MKYLIAGLGNIGDDYEQTRHNVGFEVLDGIASKKNAVFKLERHAFKCLVKHRGRSFVLIKPTTFVNKSGTAVNYWLQKEKIKPENLLVIVDDIAIPFGQLRMRAKGQDGGHNGLKNIGQVLDNSGYARLRFGIGSSYSKGRQAEYVLSKWTNEESLLLPERIEQAIKMAYSFGTIGVEKTMSSYNNL